MLHKIIFKLRDHTEMVAIVDRQSNEKAAVNKAIMVSQKHFKDSANKYYLTSATPYKAERFSIDGEKGTAFGDYNCKAIAYAHTGFKCFDRPVLRTKGTKTVYAYITKKKCLVVDVVFIYSMNQKELIAKSKEENLKKEAKNILADGKRAKTIAIRFEKAVSAIPGIGGMAEDGLVMGSMIVDYATGRYKEIPWYSILAITLAAVYLLAPVDLLPGPVDDALIVQKVYKLCKKDIDAYKEWRAKGCKPQKQIIG